MDFESQFKDLTFEEAKKRYCIFLQSHLRQFALTQNECSLCHIKGKMKACYIDKGHGSGKRSDHGLGHSSFKPQAVCEQCRIKQQSKFIEEFKMKHTNHDLGHISPTNSNNLIIIKNP